jgi:hypothetical protein
MQELIKSPRLETRIQITDEYIKSGLLKKLQTFP